MKPPHFWRHKSFLSYLLRPLSWLYMMAAQCRQRLSGEPYKAPIPVVCVGNVVMGGAGKTPVVLALIAFLQEKGYNPHVLSRGYGGRLSGPIRVDLTCHTAQDVGDEPLLLAQSAPTWIGKDRVLSAKAACDAGATVLIMDDGFQNPFLYKDISLIVMDAYQGCGNGFVFPAGPLREPLSIALKRAQAVICIGGEGTPSLSSSVPIFTGKIVSHSVLPSKKCVAFAGIGYPEKFHQTLKESGLDVLAFYAYQDHHIYSEEELSFLIDSADKLQIPLLTTTKDYVRLSKRGQSAVQPWEVDLQLSESFKKWFCGALPHKGEEFLSF